MLLNSELLLILVLVVAVAVEFQKLAQTNRHLAFFKRITELPVTIQTTIEEHL